VDYQGDNPAILYALALEERLDLLKWGIEALVGDLEASFPAPVPGGLVAVTVERLKGLLAVG
jgi:hypothetical protein